MKRLIAIALLATLPTAAPGWIADNGLVVHPVPGGFEVPYRGLSGARDFWCAAGDFVVDELDLPPDTLIFRTSSPPRRSGQGMTFSLSPEAAKKPGILLLSGKRGVSAALARGLCHRFEIES
ncbi:MAG: hypothetical protein LJE62_17480 [Silicimonas sp.]|jgi:hypothetical protein|nr:hypothetical protein [Silicimonas sp.]